MEVRPGPSSEKRGTAVWRMPKQVLTCENGPAGQERFRAGSMFVLSETVWASATPGTRAVRRTRKARIDPRNLEMQKSTSTSIREAGKGRNNTKIFQLFFGLVDLPV